MLFIITKLQGYKTKYWGFCYLLYAFYYYKIAYQKDIICHKVEIL